MAIHKIKFFAGRGSRYLAEKIVASYGTKLGESEVLNFSDGEFQPCFLRIDPRMHGLRHPVDVPSDGQSDGTAA